MTDSTKNPLTQTELSKLGAQTQHSEKPRRDVTHNPLHGISLKAIVTQLEAHYGWQALAEHIPINCFKSNPSIKSSLTFLRKTPWAREKVEALYIKANKNR